MADQIEWDIDAGLPLYTRDFIKYRKELVLAFRIGEELYSPDDVAIVMNLGQTYGRHYAFTGNRIGTICNCSIGHSHPKVGEVSG